MDGAGRALEGARRASDRAGRVFKGAKKPLDIAARAKVSEAARSR